MNSCNYHFIRVSHRSISPRYNMTRSVQSRIRQCSSFFTSRGVLINFGRSRFRRTRIDLQQDNAPAVRTRAGNLTVSVDELHISLPGFRVDERPTDRMNDRFVNEWETNKKSRKKREKVGKGKNSVIFTEDIQRRVVCNFIVNVC